MSGCPYGASEVCLFSRSPESECHFWSPIKKTCIMSSKYEDDEIEGVYWLYRMRKEKMKPPHTYDDFLQDIQRMKALQAGWLDGEGERISEAAASLAAERVSEFFQKRPPHVFPTPEGGVSLEWDTEDELDAEIGPDLKGIEIWKDKAEMKDWTREESWQELQFRWHEALASEEGNGG